MIANIICRAKDYIFPRETINVTLLANFMILINIIRSGRSLVWTLSTGKGGDDLNTLEMESTGINRENDKCTLYVRFVFVCVTAQYGFPYYNKFRFSRFQESIGYRSFYTDIMIVNGVKAVSKVKSNLKYIQYSIPNNCMVFNMSP